METDMNDSSVKRISWIDEFPVLADMLKHFPDMKRWLEFNATPEQVANCRAAYWGDAKKSKPDNQFIFYVNGIENVISKSGDSVSLRYVDIVSRAGMNPAHFPIVKCRRRPDSQPYNVAIKCVETFRMTDTPEFYVASTVYIIEQLGLSAGNTLLH